MKKLMISAALASTLVAGVAMADQALYTAIDFNNNGGATAKVSYGTQTPVPVNTNTEVSLETTSPDFTITFNANVPGGASTYQCNVLSTYNGKNMVADGAAHLQFDANMNMQQYDDSTNNPNENSVSFIKNSAPVTGHCTLLPAPKTA